MDELKAALASGVNVAGLEATAAAQANEGVAPLHICEADGLLRSNHMTNMKGCDPFI